MPTRTLLLLSALLVVPVAQARDVHVGVFDVPPLCFTEGGEPQGLFIDVLEEVAKEQGWTLNYSDGPFREQLAALRAGQIELMPGVAYNDERAAYLDYTQAPVATVWGGVFIRRGEEIPSVVDLAGKRVALMQDDMNGANFRAHAARFGIEFEVVLQPSLEAVFRAVRDGKADAGVAPNVFGYRNVATYQLVETPILFAPIAVHFATPEGQAADLRQALDQALSAWKADDASFYRERLAFWFGGEQFETERVPGWLVLVLGGAIALALLFLIYNRMLERQVRQRTRELAQSERRVRAMLDHHVQLSALLTPEGRVQLVNKAALAIAGVTAADVVGLPYWEGPWWTHDSKLQARVREAVASAGRGEFVRFDATHRTPAGALRRIDFSIKPAFDDAGRVESLVPEGHDVTELYELEERLREGHKMEAIGTLAGGIAHDFNNILTAIMSNAELARYPDVEEGELGESLEGIMIGAKRARDLVKQILTFSRKKQVERRATNLADVVEESHALLRPSLPATIAIELTLTTRGGVLGDPGELQRMIMNLCTNAMQAMPEGGTLSVGLVERELSAEERHAHPELAPGSFAVLSVADTGAGMDAATAEKVFEPYFTTRGPEGGTGLGLAVVHGVIQELGGWIELTTAPGQGARFDVYLPRHDAGDSQVEERAAPAESGSLRVLLVDDEASIVDALGRALRRFGHEVEGVSDPEAAWATFEATPDAFDVVASDLTMPKLLGSELLARCRALRPELRVVLWSGNPDPQAREAIEAGGRGVFLTKPLAPAAFNDTLRDLFARTEAVADSRE